jgi:hypothetical protein
VELTESGAVGLTWAGVAGNGAGDDEYAGADGRADPEQHEVEDAELPHEALAGSGGGGAGAEGLAAERRGAEAGEEGAAAGGGGGIVAAVFLHSACDRGGGVRLASRVWFGFRVVGVGAQIGRSDVGSCVMRRRGPAGR